MGQGLPPGSESEPSQITAAATVLVGVIVFIAVVLFVCYFGGWVAHVLTDVAKSGWASK